MTTSTTACNICAENINKKQRSLITCQYCTFECCRQCSKTYILDQSQAKCMNTSCGKEWTRKFLKDNFPNSFLEGEWNRSKEKKLFDTEQAQLPATQIIIKERYESKKIKIAMESLKNTIYNLTIKHRVECKKNKIMPTPNNEPVEIIELKFEFQNLLQKYREIKSKTTIQPVFVRSCPSENCRGYLSTEEWKCGMCYKQICETCHIIQEDNHECNPDDVATAKLLDNDTKPCPKCGTGIYKIDGCDQMWCTQCHTAFSWKTGIQETHIHNPHFYEWQRQMNNGVAPRVPGDNPNLNPEGCRENRILTHRMYYSISGTHAQTVGLIISKRMGKMIQNIIHLREVNLPQYNIVNNREIQDNKINLRILYLTNVISKEKFMKRLRIDGKKYELFQEIYQILQMFIQASTDIIFRAFEQIQQAFDFDIVMGILNEVDTVRKYTNDCFKEIGTIYKYDAKNISNLGLVDAYDVFE